MANKNSAKNNKDAKKNDTSDVVTIIVKRTTAEDLLQALTVALGGMDEPKESAPMRGGGSGLAGDNTTGSGR